MGAPMIVPIDVNLKYSVSDWELATWKIVQNRCHAKNGVHNLNVLALINHRRAKQHMKHNSIENVKTINI